MINLNHVSRNVVKVWLSRLIMPMSADVILVKPNMVGGIILNRRKNLIKVKKRLSLQRIANVINYRI